MSVRKHQTSADQTEEIKHLVDEIYPYAEKVLLIMDKLNTHKLAFLYKRFSPEEASRIIKKLEIHYTPKHDSRIDITEIELNVITRECLIRRIESISKLCSELL